MGQVTRYTFRVDDPNHTGQRIAIPKGTKRSDDLDKLFARPTGQGDETAIPDHIYVDEGELEQRVGAQPAAKFGDEDTAAGTVEPANTGVARDQDGPPRRNASLPEWQQFMRSHGQTVNDGDSRDDLVRRAEGAGLI